MCVFLISPVPIAELPTSELIDTPVFHNLAPRPIKYRVSVPIPIYDAVTPVWKLLFEKVFFFWYILASSGIKQSKLQRVGSNRSWITD